jgi:hypothetical protein
MSAIVVVYTNIEDLDRLAIPAAIYTETLAHNTSAIVAYMENNPSVLLGFAGFNSALKRANQLNSERKCGCLYTFPWQTQYAVVNSVSGSLYLTFSQQVELYQYMIANWYGNPPASYMRYLSAIALSILLRLKQTKYIIDNGGCVCGSPLVTRSFSNNYEFLQFLKQNSIYL